MPLPCYSPFYYGPSLTHDTGAKGNCISFVAASGGTACAALKEYIASTGENVGHMAMRRALISALFLHAQRTADTGKEFSQVVKTVALSVGTSEESTHSCQ